MPRYANVDKLMEHAIRLDWSVLKWVNEVNISTAINPNVVEQKKGKWIGKPIAGYSNVRCSNCNNVYRDNSGKWNFCPNCGADMREGQRMRIDENGIYDVPILEFVPIVRCKDCKHRPTGTGVNHDLEFPDDECPCQCEDYWYSWMPPDDWFCPSGERKEDVKVC